MSIAAASSGLSYQARARIADTCSSPAPVQASPKLH